MFQDKCSHDVEVPVWINLSWLFLIVVCNLIVHVHCCALLCPEWSTCVVHKQVV